MDLPLVLAACGRIVTTLWIIAAILVASGITRSCGVSAFRASR